ncbi:MAG: helix-turn-helix domain-containing protein [Egibacteraceae bacterium]
MTPEQQHQSVEAAERTGKSGLLRELRDLPAALTVEQTARILGIGRNQAYEAVAAGNLPAIRIGRRWVVPTPRLTPGTEAP